MQPPRSDRLAASPAGSKVAREDEDAEEEQLLNKLVSAKATQGVVPGAAGQSEDDGELHTVPITPASADRHPGRSSSSSDEDDAGAGSRLLRLPLRAAAHAGAALSAEAASQGFTPYLARLALIACLSGLQFGMDTGVASGLLVAVHADLGHVLSAREQELVVSATTAGAIVGALGASRLADWAGRRSAMVVAAVMFALGSIEQAASQVVRELVLGRLIQGVAVGMASMVTPTYLAEVAPASIRGRLVAVNSLLITGGQVVAYGLSAIFYRVPHGWRWMVLSCGVPAVVQLLSLLALDESPRWLVSKGRLSSARRVLQRIYPRADFAEVDQLVKDIQQSFASDTAYQARAARAAEEARLDEEERQQREHQRLAGNGDASAQAASSPAAVAQAQAQALLQQAQGSARHISRRVAPRLPDVSGAASKARGKFAQLWSSRSDRRALVLACGLQFFQQASGFNSLMYFSSRLLLMAGFKSNPNATATCIAVANLIGTIGAMRMVDSLGRRKLLLWTTAAAAFSLMLLAGSFSMIRMDGVTDEAPHAGGSGSGTGTGNSTAATDTLSSSPDQHPAAVGWAYVSLTSMVLFTLFYALGLGIVPWLVQSEVFSSPVRSVGAGCATGVNWMANLILSATYLDLVCLISAAGSFWVYALITSAAWVFAYYRLPELSGVDINDVSAAFHTDEERARGAYTAVGSEPGRDAADDGP